MKISERIENVLERGEEGDKGIKSEAGKQKGMKCKIFGLKTVV